VLLEVQLADSCKAGVVVLALQNCRYIQTFQLLTRLTTSIVSSSGQVIMDASALWMAIIRQLDMTMVRSIASHDDMLQHCKAHSMVRSTLLYAGSYRYYLTVVPTTFISAISIRTRTFVYSVTEYFMPGSSHGGGDVNVEKMPAVEFRIRMSPLATKVWYPQRQLGHFATRLCAVLGRVPQACREQARRCTVAKLLNCGAAGSICKIMMFADRSPPDA
jgi:hypothetical protein